MSAPAADDLFVVQRGTTHHKVPYSALGTLLDGDLMVAQRGTTHHKVTGAEVKAWLGGAPAAVVPGTGAPLAQLITALVTSGAVTAQFQKGVAGTFEISDRSGSVFQAGETWQWFIHSGPPGTATPAIAQGSEAAAPGQTATLVVTGSWTPPADFAGSSVVIRLYKADEGWKDFSAVPVVAP